MSWEKLDLTEEEKGLLFDIVEACNLTDCYTNMAEICSDERVRQAFYALVDHKLVVPEFGSRTGYHLLFDTEALRPTQSGLDLYFIEKL